MDLRSRIEEAMGGLSRIRSVRTFSREVLRRETAPDQRHRLLRVLTHRAAGGRLRTEVWEVREGRWDCAAPAGLPPTRGETSSALRLARLEPRNVIAHLRERPHAIRTDLRLELLDERVVYVFDPNTALCAERFDLPSGDTTSYAEWRCVDGVATPFLEVHESSGRVIEDRILGVAYDLPLPPGLFAEKDLG